MGKRGWVFSVQLCTAIKPILVVFKRYSADILQSKRVGLEASECQAKSEYENILIGNISTVLGKTEIDSFDICLLL